VDGERTPHGVEEWERTDLIPALLLQERGARVQRQMLAIGPSARHATFAEHLPDIVL
jgi:hypothetical protein